MSLPPLDIINEKLLPLAELTSRFGVHKASVWRWIHYGNDGVFLAARKLGGRWVTSEQAFQRFCDAVTQKALPNQQPVPVESSPKGFTPRQYQRDLDHRVRNAERELRKAGFNGGGRVYETSRASQELLCDLQEYIEQWLPQYPKSGRGLGRSYVMVRDAFFARAAEILEGKHGKARSLKAAIAWLESLDLKSFDVQQLSGIGPSFCADWNSILKLPEVASQIKAPVPIPVSEGGESSSDESK